MSRPALRAAALAATTSLSLLLLVACGGGSKPAYCEKQGELEGAVTQVEGAVTQVEELGHTEPGAFLGAVREVEAKIVAVAPAIREEFPTEVGKVERSVRAVVAVTKEAAAEPSVATAAKLVRGTDLLRGDLAGLETVVHEGCD
jgi:hypothetical protein